MRSSPIDSNMHTCCLLFFQAAATRGELLLVSPDLCQTRTFFFFFLFSFFVRQRLLDVCRGPVKGHESLRSAAVCGSD